MNNTQENNWKEQLEREKLHFAAQDGKIDEVKSLINGGFPINAFDDLGKTPLHYAVEGGHLEIVKFLIYSGADVNAHDESRIGNTPLGEIAANCSFEMAKILVEAGADPTIPGWMQLSALYKASKRKKEEGQKVYALLLKASKKIK